MLMFRHPLAGIQLIKGTVEPSENPADAARRELFEESGLVSKQPLFFIGKNTRMVRGQIWYFYHLDLLYKRNQWGHRAAVFFGMPCRRCRRQTAALYMRAC
ncbi:NUDIX domain-containing protein [Rhodobacteraceae bacterium]|nr:NUDIX domain-containing protein [Paracoccaceae bacterium]